MKIRLKIERWQITVMSLLTFEIIQILLIVKDERIDISEIGSQFVSMKEW